MIRFSEASKRVTSTRTVTFSPSVMAVRMKNGEGWMPVGGMLVPLQGVVNPARVGVVSGT